MRSDKAHAILRLLTQAIMKRFCQEAHASLKANSGCQDITRVGTCKLSHAHQSSAEQNSCESSQTPTLHSSAENTNVSHMADFTQA